MNTNVNVNVSGTVRIVHEMPAGSSPAVTRDELDASLQALGVRIMSVFSDQIKNLATSVDAAIGRVQLEESNLSAQVAKLQASVDQGLASPEDIESLKSIQAKLDALDLTNPATLPPPGDVPPPDVAPPADGAGPAPVSAPSSPQL